jgi:hypothetical protein
MFKINSLEELETIRKKMKWQYFEKLVAFIFEKNNFETRQNVVMIFGKTKRQFDVIAERFGELFLVECKKWLGRHGTGAIRKAVDEHLERCRLFSEKENKTASPLIVTLLEEEIKNQEGVPIVSIDKLNFFINSEKR